MSTVDGARQAHFQYISSGKLTPSLLRQPVFRAWERSHLQGVNPRRIKPIQLEALATERLLEEQQQIIATAKPYLRALSKAAGNDLHATAVGDSRAVMLDVMGDEQTLHGPGSLGVPGVLLDESTCGPNGFGTSLAEGDYVTIVGPEHLIEGFYPFSCQGIPVRDPEGEIIACLSVVVQRPEAGRRLREILVCAAHGIEMELIRRRLEQALEGVTASLNVNDALLENLRQDVMQALTAARINVELAARDLGLQRPQYVSHLLQVAGRSMQVFRRQGLLWHNLISTERSTPQPIELDSLVRDLASLLETERRTGQITLDTTNTVEPVVVWADSIETGRVIFRALLHAFDVARGGGAVIVSVRPTLDEQGEVVLNAIPPMNASTKRTTFTIERRLSKTFSLPGKEAETIGKRF